MPRVLNLDHIALNVPDLSVTTDFYTDLWGLNLIESEGNRRYLRASESSHHTVTLDTAETRGLRHISFAVSDQRDLDDAVKQAVACGGSVIREPGEALEPGHQHSAAIADPDGNVVELVWGTANITEQHRARLVAPRKLGHVVLNTPNQRSLEAFYGMLGFRVSDRTSRGMSFLRCNSDHHTLALVDSPRTGLQHAAFDVVEMDNVMVALGALRREGTPCIWGPGRHGPGRNIFTYYTDPAGNIIEYYAEMEQVDEDDDGPLEEKFWGPEHKGDVWGIAGPSPAKFRGDATP